MTHSPGPWVVSYGADERQGMEIATDIRIRDHHPEFGSMIALLHNPGVPEAESNARLIAAAPELLEALQKARNTLAGVGMASIASNICDAAIAKAKGETP